METVSEHRVEPEIAGPAPRRVGLPGRLNFLLVAAFLLLSVFLLGSGRALWEAGKLLWLAGAGQTATARVVEIRWEPPAAKGKPAVQAAIRYHLDTAVSRSAGGRLTRTGWIGVRRGERLYHLEQTLPYRYAPWFGGVAGFPWQPSPSGRIVSLLLSGGLVLLVSGFLVRRLARWVRLHLHLLRLGQATVGTITHKRTEADDMLRYFLRYGYAPTPGEGREREEQVSAEQWKRFEVGQPVTVLYDPDRPEHAGVYALIRQ